MNNILHALLVAIDYIENRNESSDENDDVQALENVGYYLQRLTEEERLILVKFLKDNKRLDIIENFGIN